jgi:hypothetical protein
MTKTQNTSKTGLISFKGTAKQLKTLLNQKDNAKRILKHNNNQKATNNGYLLGMIVFITIIFLGLAIS